jgi:hypothetical protein
MLKNDSEKVKEYYKELTKLEKSEVFLWKIYKLNFISRSDYVRQSDENCRKQCLLYDQIEQERYTIKRMGEK